MRVSHKELKRKINQEQLKITDRELFCSRAFAGFLTDMAEAATKRYKRKIKVHVFYDESENAKTAYTDNEIISINAGNSVTRSFPTKVLRSDSLIGMNAHEIGHILFTDFPMMKHYCQEMSRGRMYPAVPSFSEWEIEEKTKEVQEFLENADELTRQAITTVSQFLFNVLEDGYIEARMCDAFPGKYATGIRLNNIRISEMAQSISEQLKNGAYRFSVLLNLLIQYHRIGDINNRDGYDGEILDMFYDVLPVFEDALYDDDTKVRYEAINQILIMSWDYVQEILEQVKENQKKQNEAYAMEELQKKLHDELTGKTEEAKGNTAPVTAQGGFSIDRDKEQEKRKELQEVLSEETERIPLLETEDFETKGEGCISWDKEYSGSGYANSGSDILRILNEMSKSNAVRGLNDSLWDQLSEQSKRLELGNAHKGVNFRIFRMPGVDSNQIEAYKMVAPPLLLYSKQLQKRWKRILKERVSEGKQSGLLMGRRIESRMLMNQEGKIFSKRNLPEKKQDLAVALLIDESGSMCGLDRATYARAAAIMVYDFCKAMRIPLSIIGHTEANDVELYVYTDFDSNDENDCYRLMDISARDGNRDGAALRFVAERLMKQPESSRLLMLISDGQPAGNGGYIGTAAEEDLRGIHKEYTRKGIMFVAAAIGTDKENIERIYGDAFLDITDLQKLPFLLVKRIEKEIRR